ncbi:DUF6879 family protein [Streptomyces sp. NBC_00057]|uniref:DUF6879 family protein n=1 Tax=Streptomyces sp. NBC_00057 TaxID=2975634 RepID=UPI0032467D0E
MPQKPPAPSFEDLLDSAQQHALHLELRDVYAVGEEREVFDAFLRDGSVPADDSEFWGGWLPLVERTVARGVKVRRARVISEPVTDYIRFEHAITDANLRAGEEIRWLPRRRASTLALPGDDFWHRRPGRPLEPALRRRPGPRTRPHLGPGHSARRLQHLTDAQPRAATS